MARRSSSSRPLSSRVPRATPLAGAPDELLRLWATHRGIAYLGREGTLDRLQQLLSDRSSVLRILEGLPPLSLVVLEVLVEGGGELPDRAVGMLVRERCGNVGDIDGHLALLHQTGLVAALVADFGFRKESVWAIVDAAADALSDLLCGISLPRGPPAEPMASAAASGNERDIVALATFLVHEPLRANRDGSPNRSSLKAILKGLGIEPDPAEGRLRTAASAGMITASEGVLGPRPGRIRQVAAEGLHQRAVAELEGWLPPAGWSSLEAFRRDAWRREIDALAAHREHLSLVAGLMGMETLLRALPNRNVELASCNGTVWVRRRTVPAPATGDGHVTPNFEVYLGPAAHPEVTATIGLGCRLSRLDKVLTFRITRQSVVAGSALGLRPEDLLSALAAVGPHGVPDNVRAGVLDFYRSVKLARVRPVWAITLPPPLDTRYVETHRDVGAELVAPGIVLVGSEVDPAILDEHIREVGAVRVREDEARDPLDDEAEGPPIRIPRTTASPNAALHARLVADRAAGFQGSKVKRVPQAAAGTAATRSGARAELPRAAPQHARPAEGTRTTVDPLATALDGARGLLSAARTDLEYWAHGSPARIAELREQSLRELFPVEVAPFTALKPKWRAKILRNADTLDQVLTASRTLTGAGQMSHAGFAVSQILGSAAVIAALARRRTGGAAVPEPAAVERSEGPPIGVAETLPAVGPADFDDGFDEVPLPHPAAFPHQSRDQVVMMVRTSAAARGRLFLKLRTSEGSTVQPLDAEKVQARAGALLLLGADPRTDEGRVIRVDTIEAVIEAAEG